jgi:heme/copper-type cytochrome/quinol oxidase subunit 2
MRIVRRLAAVAVAMTLALVLAGVATACPTCKDSLAHDPASASLARGYAYSILFMLSMPPLIFGSLVLYFYWEVRKARANQPQHDQPVDLAASP